MSNTKKRGPTYRIENIVATINLNTELDLELLVDKLPMAEYNPDQFPGVILRLTKPIKVSVLIFRTGKMVCTGAKNEQELQAAVKHIVRLIQEAGIDAPLKPEVQIQNIVASGNLHAEVDLEQAALLLDNAMYEPEQFPGLIYRMSSPKVVILIFGSGKIVCTGAKREQDVKEAIEKLYNKLKEIGVLYVEEEEEEGGEGEGEEEEASVL